MKQNPILSHGFVSVNGIKLHHVSTGKGPLVLFLHGFPEFWYAWKNVLPDVASYTLRDNPAADLAAYAREARAFIQAAIYL